MKIRAIVEFDLMTVDEETTAPVDRYHSIAADLPDVIKELLIGDGFLPSDLVIGSFRVKAEIISMETAAINSHYVLSSGHKNARE